MVPFKSPLHWSFWLTPLCIGAIWFIGGGGKFIIGGGITMPDIPIGGGGGGPTPRPRGAKSSTSSSICRSVKSRSHNRNGRDIFLTSSSQCNSFSDFFGSCFLISWSTLGDLLKRERKKAIFYCWLLDQGISMNCYREMSPLLLLLANPSLAFEISPDMSPIRFGFSSCGLIGKLLSFCVKSLTVWSRFSCNRSFLSSFSDSMQGKLGN